jgi:hypothetical protein
MLHLLLALVCGKPFPTFGGFSAAHDRAANVADDILGGSNRLGANPVPIGNFGG